MAWQGQVPGAFPNGGDRSSYPFPPPPPFGDFFRFMESGGVGEGVDHVGSAPHAGPQFPPGFPFNAYSPWGGRGGRGCRRRGGPWRGGHPGRRPGSRPGDDDSSSTHDPQDTPGADTPEEDDDTMKDDPPEVPPEDDEGECPPPYGGPRGPHHHPHHGPHRGGHGHHRGGHHGPFRGPHHGPFPGHHRGPFPGPPHGPPPHGGPHHGGPPPFAFDPSTVLRNLAHHPFAQNIRQWLDAYGPPPQDSDHFTPPLDIFENEREYVLHLALPGAKKEDIGVNWNADKSHIDIAGVVHRPGDEEFQRGLLSSERRVGLFERTVKLPPEGTEASGSEVDIDGLGITAKMEDGVLVVIVPKMEKEWTEVRKVDIE